MIDRARGIGDGVAGRLPVACEVVDVRSGRSIGGTSADGRGCLVGGERG